MQYSHIERLNKKILLLLLMNQYIAGAILLMHLIFLLLLMEAFSTEHWDVFSYVLRWVLFCHYVSLLTWLRWYICWSMEHRYMDIKNNPECLKTEWNHSMKVRHSLINSVDINYRLYKHNLYIYCSWQTVLSLIMIRFWSEFTFSVKPWNLFVCGVDRHCMCWIIVQLY